MKQFIIQYWVQFSCGILAVGLATMAKRVMALRHGMMTLLRSDIIRCYEKYIGREWIPIYAMENVLESYNAYHTLGGNGTITKLVEELRCLPSNNPHE